MADLNPTARALATFLPVPLDNFTEQHGNMLQGGSPGGHGDYGHWECFPPFFDPQFDSVGIVKTNKVDRLQRILKNQLVRPCWEDSLLIQDGHYTTAGRPAGWSPKHPEDVYGVKDPNKIQIGKYVEGLTGPVFVENKIVTGQDRQHYPVSWLRAAAEVPGEEVFDRVFGKKVVDFDSSQISKLLLGLLAQRVVGVLRCYWFEPYLSTDNPPKTLYRPRPGARPESMRAEAKMIQAVVNSYDVGVGLPEMDEKVFLDYFDAVLMPEYERSPGFAVTPWQWGPGPNSGFAPAIPVGAESLWAIELGPLVPAEYRLWRALCAAPFPGALQRASRLLKVLQRHARIVADLTTAQGAFAAVVWSKEPFSRASGPIDRPTTFGTPAYPVWSPGQGPDFFAYSPWAYLPLRIGEWLKVEGDPGPKADVLLKRWCSGAGDIWSSLGFKDRNWYATIQKGDGGIVPETR